MFFFPFFVIFIVGCSHRRAWQYFIESIDQPLAFPAKCEQRCDKCKAYMGMAAAKWYVLCVCMWVNIMFTLEYMLYYAIRNVR